MNNVISRSARKIFQDLIPNLPSHPRTEQKICKITILPKTSFSTQFVNICRVFVSISYRHDSHTKKNLKPQQEIYRRIFFLTENHPIKVLKALKVRCPSLKIRGKLSNEVL